MSKIHQQSFGSGKPIVLVHGWAMHSGIWQQFAQQLAQHYRVICVDLPGHGRSEAIDPFVLAAVSHALAASIEEPGVCWLGWSLGATVVLDLASRFPERVSSLILLSGNPHFTRTEHWPGMLPTVLDAFSNSLYKDCQAALLRFLSLQINHELPTHKDLLKALKTAVIECPSPSFSTLLGALQVLKTADLRTALANMKLPVSIILGDRDTLVPVTVGQKMQELLPVSELNILSKAGHVPFLSHEQELVTIIFRFMGRQ